MTGRTIIVPPGSPTTAHARYAAVGRWTAPSLGHRTSGVEAEVRAILDAAVNLPERNFLVALHESMAQAGGVDLDIPERSDQPRPVDLP